MARGRSWVLAATSGNWQFALTLTLADAGGRKEREPPRVKGDGQGEGSSRGGLYIYIDIDSNIYCGLQNNRPKDDEKIPENLFRGRKDDEKTVE